MNDLTLSAVDLECHFKWGLEAGIDKKISEVIESVLEKLELEPFNKVPYLCLLSYLYTRKRNESYAKAYDCLKQAEQLNAEIDSGFLSSDFIGCKFAVEANRLNIDAIRREKTDDHERRLIKLFSMWNDADEKARNAVRASVLLVKSLSCLRFGPSKYQMGADAAAEAASLSPTSFHDAYLQAYILSRIRRLDDINSLPDVEEFNLWADAMRLTEQSHLDNRRDYSCVQLSVVSVHYAEAIVRNPSLCELTESLADRAKSLLATLSESVVEKNFRIGMKCVKVYRILKKSNKVKEMLKLLIPLKERTRKAQLLLELACAVQDTDIHEYEQLLLQGQRVADAPGHIWIDLKLLIHQSSWRRLPRLTQEEVIIRYDDLYKQYQCNPMNQAVILYQKGAYYAIIGRRDKAMDWMLRAVETDSSVGKKISSWERNNTLRNMQNRGYLTEWQAWYIDNILNSLHGSQVQSLYTQVLSSNPVNQFALQHYGMNRIRAGDFQEAEKLFRRLEFSCDLRRKLLSRALLHQIDSSQEADISKVKECLSLGCKDACLTAVNLLHKLQLFDTAMLMKCIRDRLMSDDASSLNGALLTPISTCSYEFCAQIEHLLDSHSAFFISEELDSPEFFAEIGNKLQALLRTKTSGAFAMKRGNAMRENRLRSSKLFITDPEFATAELNEAIVAALKDARESLDRSFLAFLSRTGNKQQSLEFYPHGYMYVKKEIKKDRDFNLRKKSLSGVVDKKLHEMASIVKFISAESKDSLETHIRKKLPNVFDFSAGDNDETVRDILALRESGIISSQGPWLVIWQYMVNLEKHASKIDIAELNFKLAEFNRTEDPPLNAYEMMHRAVEYAEETAVILDAAKVQPSQLAGVMG